MASNYPPGVTDVDIDEHFGPDEDTRPLCPNCGEHADFRELQATHTETHGLDCGPFETWTETWLECSNCGAQTDDGEIAEMNK
jgi:hypothetical protein